MALCNIYSTSVVCCCAAVVVLLLFVALYMFLLFPAEKLRWKYAGSGQLATSRDRFDWRKRVKHKDRTLEQI